MTYLMLTSTPLRPTMVLHQVHSHHLWVVRKYHINKLIISYCSAKLLTLQLPNKYFVDIEMWNVMYVALSWLLPAVGVDPPDEAVAGEPYKCQYSSQCSAEAGRIPRLPWTSKASSAWREGTTWDDIQHTGNTAPARQSTGVLADRRKAHQGKLNLSY